MLVVVIGAISAAAWVFRRMQMYGIINFESRAMTDLYASAFDHLIDHSYQFFISHFSGTIDPARQEIMRARSRRSWTAS